MENEAVALSAAVMEDEGRHTLVAEIDDRLQHVEDAIQQYIAGNLGEWPGKAFKVVATIEVEAVGLFARTVSFKVEEKAPSLSRTYSQQAASRDGVLTMAPPGRQQTLSLDRAMTVGDLEAGSDE